MKGWISVVILFVSGISLADNISDRYDRLQGPKPGVELFRLAMEGYTQVQTPEHKKQLLTIIDFRLPSTDKRLWVIDLNSDSTLIHTYVSHGINTGNLFATSFSNTINSNQSSLGFYRTAEPYYGKNGYSLRLDGLEKGINSNARRRAIVIHGAWYANPSMIRKTGRLGRSFGCPAVPQEVHRSLIDTIANGSILFIYKPEQSYFEASDLL